MSDEPSPPSGNPSPEKKSPSWVKMTLIRILRGMIRTLEGVVTELESESPEGWGRIGSIVLLWEGLIGRVRSFLPLSWQRQLSDSVLGGMVVFLLMAVFVGTLRLLPGKSPEVAILPPTVPTSEPRISPEISPSPLVTPSVFPSPIIPEITPTPGTSEGLESSENPIETEIEESPLTPEQALILRVEKTMKEISTPLGESLIAKIDVNFLGSLLSLGIGDDWYNLSANEQDLFVNQLREASQDLDFSKLEIFDSRGTEIARTPVVGSRMVVLERKLNQEGWN